MKYIVKQTEPDLLSKWKALADDNWQPSYEDLQGKEKHAVKHALMAEQGYICCYCERRLIDDDSHIEHFQPQSDEAVDPLDFSNLLCSCQNQLKKGEPRHCGNLKADWFDSEWLISPLNPNCEQRFAFTGDGQIKPARDTDLAAQQTIEKLGLAIPKLKALRAEILEPFLDESLSADELNAFVAGYLRQDSEGRFSEFWTMIRYLFG